MIYTSINELNQYTGLNANLDKAIKLLETINLKTLQIGPTIIDDDITIMKFEYFADGKENDFFEGHEKYLDIHIVLEGKEAITCLNRNKAKQRTPFDKLNDVGFYDGEYDSKVILDNASCLIVFPNDLHQPKVKVNDDKIIKIVFKVKI